MGNRKQVILNFLLKKREGVGTNTLAEALDISRTAVQQHMSILERDGLIQQGALTKTAGRPVRLYVLTELGLSLFPKQYAWFSELLLDDLKENLGSEEFAAFMSRLGKQTANKLLAQVGDLTKQEKVDFLMTTMQTMGYEVSADKQLEIEGAVKITACNCVYHDIAMKHKEICEFDRLFISTVLDQKIEQTSCMATGGNTCKFLLE
ncbi:MAG: HTH domain-containing protein [Cycloclasticus sp.]|nr:HTH domain-containing protein [Cycloclasticus sp.]